MCLITFAWRPDHDRPLIVAANRDEFYARPTAAAAEWEHAPGVYAGRDLEAGGTWLGVGPQGRFAAVTNIRAVASRPASRSRGELCAAYLTGEVDLGDYARQVCDRAQAYGGFNLLLGDGSNLYYLNSHSRVPHALAAGVYGLSNAALDTPWPKLLKAREGFAALLESSPEQLMALLSDPTLAKDADLPETGVGLATERLLSSVFIASPTYGTRASTVLVAWADGRRTLVERSFGPGGGRLGEVSFEIPG